MYPKLLCRFEVDGGPVCVPGAVVPVAVDGGPVVCVPGAGVPVCVPGAGVPVAVDGGPVVFVTGASMPGVVCVTAGHVCRG